MSISALRRDALLALAATLLVLTVQVVTGFKTLWDFGGDNDSLLRLVEVRDLIGGQGWFDLHQYRMGPEGGFVMHWSRLVDAPLAGITLAVAAVTGSMATGEIAAEILWPALLFCLTLFFIVRMARLFDGDRAVLPAAVVGAAALHFIGVFLPGALDHHNVQLMLASAALYALLEAPEHGLAAGLAGVCSALMLAVGMETAPHVATLGLCAAGLFALRGAEEGKTARDFGLGFAGVSAVVFFATVPISEWGQAQCDAFSLTQFALAALGGLGLALVVSVRFAASTPAKRLLSLGLLGAACVLVVAWAFPQCLASPYAGLDPRLKEDWLDHVSEARSLFQLLAGKPEVVVARYVTPLLAIILLALRLRRSGWRRQDVLVGAALLMAFVVSIWQVRGSTFSIAFAVVPLSAWIGEWRQRAATSPSAGASARMVAAWLLSLNASWTGAAAATSLALEDEAVTRQNALTAATSCTAAADYPTLAAQPATMVLASSNLGSPILAYSGHRVFAGPYHRNIAGNLLVLDALMGTPDEGERIVREHSVGLVAFCRGDSESQFLSERAPDGLLAGLMRDAVPEWLELLPETAGQPLELYRVRPRS